MKWISLTASTAVSLFILTAGAATPHKRPPREISADTAGTSAPSPRRTQKSMTPVAVTLPSSVGDPDSFGRNERYLGLAQTSAILLSTDCASEPVEGDDRCITLNPDPAVTIFTQQDLARIDLPASASNSLICFQLTPFIDFEFYNSTSTPQPAARFITRAQVTVENEVLNDPTLVDANGVPYAGAFTTTFGTYFESRSLAVNERAAKSSSLSRNCVGGLISRSFLIEGLGLSDAQATAFFASPITLRFGSSGSASLVSYASYLYGIRLYGD